MRKKPVSTKSGNVNLTSSPWRSSSVAERKKPAESSLSADLDGNSILNAAASQTYRPRRLI